ncbi:AMP-binding protein [Tsukamurella soli]|uniref:(2,3-dihydroxybenzoyl)adenylate synthase EntE n=1 Tax=Tsukamurella soli TaxID=644556 RepID=A0ABP8JKB8_9ACTN
MRIDRWREYVGSVSPEELARLRDCGDWENVTIGAHLHRAALEHSYRPAVIAAGGMYTYRELDERSDRVAAGLADLGLRPGGAVLLQLDNTLDAVLAWYGVIKAGLVPVATLLAYRGHEIGEIGSQTEAVAHIVAADYSKFDLTGFAVEMAERAAGRRVVITVGAVTAGAGTHRLEDLGAELEPAVARSAVERIDEGIDGDDIGVFQLSGGTTGTPKVIPRRHDDYWLTSRQFTQRLGWDETTRVMHFLPLIHNAGILLALHAAHTVGAAVVVATPAVDTLLQVMIDNGVTDFLGYGALAVEWAMRPDFDRATAALRHVVYSGTRVTDDAFAIFADRGISVLHLYGSSEGLVMVTPEEWPAQARQHTLGTPLSEDETVRVLAPGAEREVPDGAPGELCYRGPSTLRGYLRNPTANAEGFTSDGLLRSGDLVSRRTVDGAVTYVFEGRIKDVIHRGGEKVSTAEIEALVARMPGVARVALVAVPDHRLGERGCIVVEPVPGALTPTLGQVTEFLAQLEVAKFKWPERLESMDALPLTPVGKLDKRALRARMATTPRQTEEIRS